MTYLLDTNVCILYINGKAPHIREKVGALREGEAVLCSVVVGELLYGGYHSQHPKATLAKQRAFIDLFESLPYDDRAAEYYAQFRAELARAGTPIGGNDLMIAAIARTHNLTLVTHNSREFARVPGLKLEDWET